MLDTVLLQIVNMSVIDYTAHSGVGRLELSRYLGCTTKTVGARMQSLITSGHVKEFQTSASRGNGWRYSYNLTDNGLEFLHNNYDAIKQDFEAWQNQELIVELRLARNPISTPKSKKQSKQDAAGQKELF